MVKLIMIIILIILLCILLLSIIHAVVILKPPAGSIKRTEKIQKALDRLMSGQATRINKEELAIPSPNGYNIKAKFIQGSSLDKALILVLDAPFSSYTAAKYIDIFIKQDFNILIYNYWDQWESNKRKCTYGYNEKLDIKACADWIFDLCGLGCHLGVLGESVGAAIALQSINYDKRISFCIADSSFSNLYDELEWQFKRKYHLPSFPWLKISDITYKILSKVSYKDISPINYMRGMIKPVLFVHGMNDKFIPPKMTQDMYELKTGRKELYLVPGANHGECYTKDKEKYEQVVDEFLNKVLSK